MLNTQIAQAAQSTAKTAKGALSPLLVEAMLAEVKGTTFANITQVTKVDLAAKYKGTVINKITVASVCLFNNLLDSTNPYLNAVKRTAKQDENNEAAAVEGFQVSSNYFDHVSNVWSLVKHKTKDAYYLLPIYNSAESIYLDSDGNELTKAEVAAFMTPSAAKKLLGESSETHNVTNDVTHNVQIRTVSLENIIRIATNGKVLEIA